MLFNTTRRIRKLISFRNSASCLGRIPVRGVTACGRKIKFWLPFCASQILILCVPFNINEKYAYWRSLREVDRYPTKLSGTAHTWVEGYNPECPLLCRQSAKYLRYIFSEFLWMCAGFSRIWLPAVLHAIFREFSNLLTMLKDVQDFLKIFTIFLALVLFNTGFFFGGGDNWIFLWGNKTF